MQINKLIVQNFRGFEYKEFNLDPRFTVAIGDNGTGKSTLLHAMQVASGTFFLGLPHVKRRHIEEEEIRTAINPSSTYLQYFTPTIVEATGSINGSGEFTWRRIVIEHGRGTTARAADVGKIKELAANYASRVHEVPHPLFPLIAFFGVRHLGAKVIRQKRTKKHKVLIRDGYYNALGQKSDEAAFTEWFYNYDENLAVNLEFKGTREAVFNAIENAIPYLRNVSFDRHYFQLQAEVNIPGQSPRRILHNYMSDGIKRMLGIVADVAYRCVILNGFKGIDAVTDTKGIVMIDELDMHLHPNWQRHVASDLKKAFPNIQFVVTTHSPFIVQSLSANEVFNLDEPKDINPNKMRVDEVATNILGVESAYSENNEDLYQKSKKILIDIKGNKTSTEIQNEINDIHDPAVRAFLELNKMANRK